MEGIPLENNYGPERGFIEKKSSKGKVIFSSITGGIIGSLLTLAIAVPFSDEILNQFNTVNQVQPLTEAKEKTSNDAVTAVNVSNSAAGQTGSLADMVETASKSIVGVVNIKQQSNGFTAMPQSVESGTGSGVIFKKTDGAAYIVTNNHVIEGANQVEITLADGKKVTAKIVGADALTDLAVLEIDPKYVSSVINFGDSDGLRPGDQVVAIGNPLGLDFAGTVTQGIVSAVNRTMDVSTSSGAWELSVIQTDAAINPGNSGGALINTQGLVIGINSLKISESGVEGLGFAIPSNDVIPIVNELIEKGKIERPYLGVGLADLEQIPSQYLQRLPENITKGTMITNIEPGSAADKAGLEVQDIIVSFNGSKIEKASDLRKYLYSTADIGEKVKLEVYRNGELKSITVPLTE